LLETVRVSRVCNLRANGSRTALGEHYKAYLGWRMLRVDVAILGAGAAGLVAAIRAAERGKSVVLLEKNRRAGVKILMSGGTRCNLTNARGLRDLSVVTGLIDSSYDPRYARGAKSIQDAFGAGGRFLGPALRALSVEKTITLFEAEGVATKVEANGKIFPVSDRAVDVLEALLRRLRRSGAQLRTDCAANAVESIEQGFRIDTPADPIEAERVVVAVGGQSYPGCGTTGDGFALARRFGHSIVEPKPALVPVRVDAPWVTELKGLTLPDVTASVVVSSTTTKLQERRESVLFAHFGLTGPAILDVSRAVARHEGPERLDLLLDLLPDQRAEEYERQLSSDCRVGRPTIAVLLARSIPRRLVDILMTLARVPGDRVGPELTREERSRLVVQIKSLRLPIVATLGFAKAEVTCGGVQLDEVNPETLESRLRPGLHFVGEVLDLDGLIGGYNFQAAWSTGWLAGDAV
jgi:predicted Rossmann fold flavoprotein